VTKAGREGCDEAGGAVARPEQTAQRASWRFSRGGATWLEEEDAELDVMVETRRFVRRLRRWESGAFSLREV